MVAPAKKFVRSLGLNVLGGVLAYPAAQSVIFAFGFVYTLPTGLETFIFVTTYSGLVCVVIFRVWDDVRTFSEDVEIYFILNNDKNLSAETAEHPTCPRLYDEDESMMIGRQEQLDRLRDPKAAKPERLVLGTIDDLRDRLPITFEFAGNPFRLVKWDGHLLAHSTVCPHFLGPLEHCAIEVGGIVTCPWLVCIFDIATGKSADQNTFCLQTPPRIQFDVATREIVAVRS